MKTNKNLKFAVLILTLLVALFIYNTMVSNNKNSNNYAISLLKLNYFNAISQTNNDLNLEFSEAQTAILDFESGDNIAAFDTQGVLLADMNKEYSFTPHLTQTVVIAVDKSIVSEDIKTFKDLLTTNYEINFEFGKRIADNMWEFPKTHHIVLAMSTALYGQYDINSISQDFEKLNEENRFFVNDEEKPIIVSYDSHIVDMIKAGRDLEIIIPQDGTLSFNYGALIYNESIDFNDNLSQALIEHGYRLPNGECDENYYPQISEYMNAEYIVDFNEYNEAASKISKTLRRDSFHTRLHGFTNQIETTSFFLPLLSLVIFYLVSIRRRLTDEETRKNVTYSLMLMIFFISAGLIKGINGRNSFIETLLWYSYYIPILLIPALFVKIAIKTGVKNVSEKILKAYSIYFKATLMLLVIIFTNTIHNFVFIIYDYDHSYYTHNIGYYIILSWVLVSVLFAYILLLKRNIGSPKKLALTYPAIMGVIVLFYSIALILRFPPIREFDVSFAIVMLVLLFIESCIKSGLFLSNKGYSKLFYNSNLAMEIRDKSKNTVYKSYITKNVDENYIKKSADIIGGEFIYFEDYTAINTAKRKLKSVNNQIKRNNKFLMQKSEILSDLAQTTAQKSVYDSIDKTLISKTKKIENLIEKIKQGEDKKKILNKVSIYATVMKRECMYRINVLYKTSQSLSILFNSMFELNEFLEKINLNLILRNDLETDLLTDDILKMYTFFTKALFNAIEYSCKNIVVQIYKEKDSVILSILSEKELFDDNEIEDITNGEFRYDLHSKNWEDSKIYLLKI